MYHSVTIGSKNTWADWRLIPSSPPFVAPPPVRKNMVELPGGNGSIDLTQFIGNTIHYGVSEGTWDFVIADQSIPRELQVSEIAKYLHGKRFEKIIFEDDPDWYYSGRLEIASIKPAKNYSAITINYTIDPFKRQSRNGMVVTSL